MFKALFMFFALMVTASLFSVETTSFMNKASPVVSMLVSENTNAIAVDKVNVQMQQLGLVQASEHSLNFAQMQGKSTDAEGQMNLNAQMTKLSKEQFCMMQARPGLWRASNLFSLNSTAQIENTQQVMTTVALSSIMMLNKSCQDVSLLRQHPLKKPIARLLDYEIASPFIAVAGGPLLFLINQSRVNSPVTIPSSAVHTNAVNNLTAENLS